MNYQGILGYTFLSRFVTTIDYKRERVSFAPHLLALKKNHAEASSSNCCVVPATTHGGLIFVQAILNGQDKGTFVVDTGSAENLILPRKLPAIERLACPLPDYEGVKSLFVRSVAVKEALAKDVPFIVHTPPQEFSAQAGYDGILGYPFLSNFTVTINYRDKQIVFAHPLQHVQGPD